MVDRDVRGLGDDQIDVAVQSAVDVDVARRRKHVEPGRVVDDRPQQVLFAVAQVAGQLERESPEPAAMFPDLTIRSVTVPAPEKRMKTRLLRHSSGTWMSFM